MIICFTFQKDPIKVRGSGSPNLGSSFRNVFKQTSSRDNEEDSMGLGDRLKGKGDQRKE